MPFDSSKLKGRIKERLGTQDVFARQMGLSSAAISNKLNGKTEFTQGEIKEACRLLSITHEEIGVYFFTV